MNHQSLATARRRPLVPLIAGRLTRLFQAPSVTVAPSCRTALLDLAADFDRRIA